MVDAEQIKIVLAFGLEGNSVPSDIALIKIMDARMKIMRDARPRAAMSLLTTCCPTKAAIVATPTRYRAA